MTREQYSVNCFLFISDWIQLQQKVPQQHVLSGHPEVPSRTTQRLLRAWLAVPKPAW
jgi:hypothetical protein